MNSAFFAIVVCVLGLALTASAADAPKAAAVPAGEKTGTLYHVVSFKFKEKATPEQIKAVEDAFAALKTKIPEIKTLTWGTNVSPEKHDKGFTHCWVLTFGSDKDRDAYLVHPEHKAFGQLVGPAIADVTVIDFWGK